jgi:hypothetical protein
MNTQPEFRIAMFLLLAFLMLFSFASCGDDDDDDDDDAVGDDDDDDDDATDDDDAVGDDDDDDDDDDNDDDDTIGDLWVAPWPQENVEALDYDEGLTAGFNRQKAEEYDQFHLDWHQPYYGSTVGRVHFTDDSRTEVSYYGDYGDSCIWTGTYATSQAFRYHVTGDPEAKANAIRAITTLDRHLHITGRTGFIARYAGPKDAKMYYAYGGDAWCDPRPSCHHIETGPYAGDWWDGNTSRDQYTGWFMGMVTAYDLVDDASMRQMIADDITEVLDELIASNWWIMDVDGKPTTRAPNVMSSQQLTWSLIGYHITGEVRFKAEVQNWIADAKRPIMRLMNTTIMNRYVQYYGNNLGHQNFYTLLRLGEVYLGPEDYEFFLEVFDTQTHSFTRLSHNAYFNAIHMSQGVYEPTKASDPYQDQLEQDIDEFRDAPNWVYFVDPSDGVLDPVSIFLDNLMTQYPFIAELLGGGGDANPQNLDAHPVLEQCTADFLWQRNPFRIDPCGADDPSTTRPGVDYLTAYWMASYHKFIDKTF